MAFSRIFRRNTGCRIWRLWSSRIFFQQDKTNHVLFLWNLMTKVNKSEGKLPRRLEEGDAGENLWAFSDCSHYLPSIIYYWHLILQERERMLVVTFMPGHHFEELQGCKKIRSIENKVPSYSRIESSQNLAYLAWWFECGNFRVRVK